MHFLSRQLFIIVISIDEEDEEDDDEAVLVPDLVGLEGSSLPPDRTSFQPLPLATKVAQVIPPYRYDLYLFFLCADPTVVRSFLFSYFSKKNF